VFTFESDSLIDCCVCVITVINLYEREHIPDEFLHACEHVVEYFTTVKVSHNRVRTLIAKVSVLSYNRDW
jgi:hypothetical protein